MTSKKDCSVQDEEAQSGKKVVVEAEPENPFIAFRKEMSSGFKKLKAQIGKEVDAAEVYLWNETNNAKWALLQAQDTIFKQEAEIKELREKMEVHTVEVQQLRDRLEKDQEKRRVLQRNLTRHQHVLRKIYDDFVRQAQTRNIGGGPWQGTPAWGKITGMGEHLRTLKTIKEKQGE